MRCAEKQTRKVRGLEKVRGEKERPIIVDDDDEIGRAALGSARPRRKGKQSSHAVSSLEAVYMRSNVVSDALTPSSLARCRWLSSAQAHVCRSSSQSPRCS